MKKLRFSKLLLLIVVSTTLAAPMTGEDDEYEDDVELPHRKVQPMEKLQEELHKQALRTTSTTQKPHPLKPIPLKEENKWLHSKAFRGYQILSDGPKIVTELVRTKPMLRIRIDAPGTIRDVEKTLNRRHLELKIRNWNRVDKVHIKVPFGYQPEDLRVAELRDHIDVIAPIYYDVDEEQLGEQSDEN